MGEFFCKRVNTEFHFFTEKNLKSNPGTLIDGRRKINQSGLKHQFKLQLLYFDHFTKKVSTQYHSANDVNCDELCFCDNVKLF